MLAAELHHVLLDLDDHAEQDVRDVTQAGGGNEERSHCRENADRRMLDEQPMTYDMEFGHLLWRHRHCFICRRYDAEQHDERCENGETDEIE